MRPCIPTSAVLADSSPTSEDVEVQVPDPGNEGYSSEKTSVKRVKVAASPQSQAKFVQPKKVTRKPRKNLSLLPTMPLDIVFEILGFLTPRDLLTLSKINKLFRSTLLSPQVTFVWKSCRERAGGPACPSDFTEVERALLLFGVGCQSCGTPHTRKIDFFIRRRVCASCRKDGILVKSKFRNLFPREDKSVLDLLPSTNEDGDSEYYLHSRCNYYWITDIDDMIHRLSVLRDNITKGLPNAAQDLETFKAEQKQHVKDIRDDIPRLNAWKNDVTQQRRQDVRDKLERRKNDILDRMMQLGHLREDLTWVGMDSACWRTTELTERVWQRIRPGLEAKATRSRENRLIKERESVLTQRREIVKSLYDTFKATLLPSQWTYLPRVLDVCNFECFKALIEADVDVSIDKEDFSGCMEMLPELLVERLEELRASLRESIGTVTNHAPISPSPSMSATPPDNPVPGVDVLDLAIATFDCQGDCRKHRDTGTRSARLAIGWSTIASHYYDYDYEESTATVLWRSSMVGGSNSEAQKRQFVFNVEAAVVAQDLVRCAGLGEHALASEMDAKNLKFGCKLCFNMQKTSLHYRVGFGWRDAVYHRTTAHSDIISAPFVDWVVLPDGEESKVVEREHEDTKWRYPLYACNHCAAYLNCKGEKDEVRAHVQTMHGIEDPQNLDDYFYFERYRTVLDDNNRSYSVLDPDAYTSFCYHRSRLECFSISWCLSYFAS